MSLLSARSRRAEVSRVLEAWAAKYNDSKEIRKSLGYKCPLGILDKQHNGRNTAYSDPEPFEFDSECLDVVNSIVEGLCSESRRLVYFEYQDHANTDRFDYTDKSQIEAARKYKREYRLKRDLRWSRESGRARTAYKMALSRLKDDLASLILNKL